MESQEVIYNRLIQRAINTDARLTEGVLEVDCIVREGGELLQRTLLIEQPGQDLLKHVLAGRDNLPKVD